MKAHFKKISTSIPMSYNNHHHHHLMGAYICPVSHMYKCIIHACVNWTICFLHIPPPREAPSESGVTTMVTNSWFWTDFQV